MKKANFCKILSVILSMVSVICNEETGNSLVNCAACLSVQTQVDNWSCDVNCKVVHSENDGLITSGIVQNLIQQLQQLNDTVQQQAKTIEELKAPTELFSARAFRSGDNYLSHTDGERFVFPYEILDYLDSYDNVTGVFTAQNTGIYNLALTVRSGSQVGDTNIYRKKPGETEETLCVAKGQGGGHDSICLLLQPLNAGDEVYVKFRGNGQVILSKCFFHATYLYKYE